jgi:hypothetical protein
MRNELGWVVVATSLLVSSSAYSQYGFDSLEGKWVSVTPGADLGEPVWFHPAFEGYDVVVPFFPGQSFVGRVTDGHGGAHVIVSSRDGQKCWYYVGIINHKEMTWALRDSNSENCPRSSLFRRDP